MFEEQATVGMMMVGELALESQVEDRGAWVVADWFAWDHWSW